MHTHDETMRDRATRPGMNRRRCLVGSYIRPGRLALFGWELYQTGGRQEALLGWELYHPSTKKEGGREIWRLSGRRADCGDCQEDCQRDVQTRLSWGTKSSAYRDENERREEGRGGEREEWVDGGETWRRCLGAIRVRERDMGAYQEERRG